MSLTFKLLSLAIRTAAKPIGNYIKRQAKEHDGFKRFAVAQAQRVHRIDMRMRLGILHDAAAQDRMHERELKAAEDKKRAAETPTVRTEAEQKKHDEEKAREQEQQKDGKKKEEKSSSSRVRIRPLSEARAIELGANFFSEAFIFAVAAGLLIWDAWRSRRKETARRDMVAERIQQLEDEVESLHAQLRPSEQRLLLGPGASRAAPVEAERSWWNPLSWSWSTVGTANASGTPSSDPPTNSSPTPDAPGATSSSANVPASEAKPAESDAEPAQRVDSVAAAHANR